MGRTISMKVLHKIFGGINLTWLKVIILAVVTGIYTGLINQVPFLLDTSFRDIAISFEVWIFFGIFIIMNSKSNLDSALKCFVFFLISQPLVYLVEVPFLGWEVMNYYRNWILWTVLTFPMGFIGYYMKKDKWWGLFILTPILLLLGDHYASFLGETIFSFPNHLLSCIFCAVTMIIYVIAIFNGKKTKIAGLIISVSLIAVFTVMTVLNPTVYDTVVMTSDAKSEVYFDESYKVYLSDESFGTLDVDVHKGETKEEDFYLLHAVFKKAGKTDVIIESPGGERSVYEIDIRRHDYDLVKK